MIEKTIICPHCGAEYKVTHYCTISRCPYCDSEEEFEGFRYKKIDYNHSNYTHLEYWTDCPRCNSPNMAYSQDKGCWHCFDCGYEMSQEWLERSVLWFCDKCDAYMNIQRGFSTYTGSWKCTNCGYDNDVTEDNII